MPEVQIGMALISAALISRRHAFAGWTCGAQSWLALVWIEPI